jgi:hypothetical protein
MYTLAMCVDVVVDLTVFSLRSFQLNPRIIHLLSVRTAGGIECEILSEFGVRRANAVGFE